MDKPNFVLLKTDGTYEFSYGHAGNLRETAEEGEYLYVFMFISSTSKTRFHAASIGVSGMKTWSATPYSEVPDEIVKRAKQLCLVLDVAYAEGHQ